MAAALARVVGGGAAARLSLAEMMGVRGARVAPRGLGVPRRPGLHSRPAGRLDEKPVPHRFPCEINFTREIARFARDRWSKRCIPRVSPQNWTLLHRSAVQAAVSSNSRQ